MFSYVCWLFVCFLESNVLLCWSICPFLSHFHIVFIILASDEPSFLVGRSPNLLFQNYFSYSDLFSLPNEFQVHLFLLIFGLALYPISEYFRENCHLHHIKSLLSSNILCLSIYSSCVSLMVFYNIRQKGHAHLLLDSFLSALCFCCEW